MLDRGSFLSLSPNAAIGEFGQKYRGAVGLFGDMAGNLASHNNGMDVNPANLQALRKARGEANQIYETARNRLPKVQKGLTGAQSGHWSAGTASAVTLLTILISAFQQLRNTWEQKKNNESVSWGPATVTTLSAIFYTVQWVFWWKHAENSKKAAQFIEANPIENKSIEQMIELADAADDLARGINWTPDSHDTQWPQIRRIHRVYRQLPEDQQAQIGSLPALKELYLNKIRAACQNADGRVIKGNSPIDYNKNELVKVYDRLRILGYAWKLQNNKKMSLNVSQEFDSIEHLDFSLLKEIAEKTLNEARGDWDSLPDKIGYTLCDNTYKHNPRELLIRNSEMVRLWIALDWMRLEGYIKELPEITLHHGDRLAKSDLFDTQIPIKDQRFRKQSTFMIQIDDL